MVYQRYVLRHLCVATLVIATTLTGIVCLTQSLRFLELVMQSGASAAMFWFLTLLALPRFFETILPLAIMSATLFVYNRMTTDSEIVVMRASGFSPMALARPALLLSLFMMFFLWLTTLWLSPASVSQMKHMRQFLKAQYSVLLFREGVFNTIRPGVTVFIREKTPDGRLRGLMIHDARKEIGNPVTILAQEGGFVETPDGGQQVVVYDGTRQELDPKTGSLSRLSFERYILEIPQTEDDSVDRWRDPDERSFGELLNPDMNNARDREQGQAFVAEAHRRILSPLLAPVYTILALCAVLLGQTDRRRGQARRIAGAVVLVIALQSGFLAASNLSSRHLWGVPLLYLITIAPLVLGLTALSEKPRMLLFGRKARC